MHGPFFSVHKMCEEECILPRLENRNGAFFFFFLHSGFPPPIFFCLDCGFMMCYGIHETTMKPDVLSNVSMHSLNNFAEVEPRAHHVASVRTF